MSGCRVSGVLPWQNRDVTKEKAVLDLLDRRIIGLLGNEGRISFKELADRVHLAPSSVADRVRRLESLGVITGYGARIDRAALGRDVRAVVAHCIVSSGGALKRLADLQPSLEEVYTHYFDEVRHAA